RALLESGEIDALLMTGYFGGYSRYSEEFSQRETEAAVEIARAARDTGRPVVAQSMYHDAPPSEALRADGTPVYATIESAAAAMAALTRNGRASGAPPLPEPRVGPLDESYFGARRLLEEAGIEFVAARRVRTADEAHAAA